METNPSPNVQFTGNPKPFGVIGLVIAILAMLFSFIPCIGAYAIGPALIAGIFCTIAFLYARHHKQNHSVPLAGLIIAVVAMGIGIYQHVRYNEVFEAKKEVEQAFDREITNMVLDTLNKAVEKEKRLDSIKQAEKDSLNW